MPPILTDSLLVLFSLALILLAAELFTNGVEWLGAKLKLAEGAVGSVLAAVGTALPETIIPIVAIIGDAANNRLFTPESHAQSVGMGAIIGAPFMLGTLAFFVVGISFFIAKRSGRRLQPFSVAPDVVRGDIEFFLIAFTTGCGAGLLRYYWTTMPRQLDWLLAAVLVVVYFIYLKRIFRAGEQANTSELQPLHMLFYPRLWLRGGSDIEARRVAPLVISRLLEKLDPGNPLKRYVGLQLVIALAVMIAGAHIFVGHMIPLAQAIGVNPLILALLLVPVATELPEKFNSVLWVMRGKDTLALGNISGAMVFQSTFPISLGLLFLDWSFAPNNPAVISALAGVIGALALYIGLRLTGRVSPYLLLAGGALYAAYLLIVLLHIYGVIHLGVEPAGINLGH